MRCQHADSAAARCARPSERASRSTAASKHMASVDMSTDFNCQLLTQVSASDSHEACHMWGFEITQAGGALLWDLLASYLCARSPLACATTGEVRQPQPGAGLQ